MPTILDGPDTAKDAKGDTIRGKEQSLAAAAKTKLTRALELTEEIYATGGKKEVVIAKVNETKKLIADAYNEHLDPIKILRQGQ